MKFDLEKKFIEKAKFLFAVCIIFISLININHLIIDHFMKEDFKLEKCRPAGHTYALPSDDCKPVQKKQ